MTESDQYIETLVTELKKDYYMVERNRGKTTIRFYLKKYSTSKLEVKELSREQIEQHLKNKTIPNK